MSLCDSFGRELSYLRLSLISKCNLNCWYCRPYEKSQEGDQSFPLNISEIKNLAKALGPLGIKKIRLTGGEPTLRNDLAKIIQALAETNYFEKIALSTNGLRLKTLARPLQSAGLHALNISVDSLDPQQYYQITGADRLSDVLEGIDASLQTGIKTIKINAVLMKGINSESLSSFLALIKKAPLSVRFIEFMKTENNSSLFTRLHLSTEVIRAQLELLGWKKNPSSPVDGPAITYRHSDFAGSVGLISPYSRKFCDQCNRIRIDSSGNMRMCLFGKVDYNLRHLLREQSSIPQLQQTILQLVNLKPKEHRLENGDFGQIQNLLSIGG